jgi:hypothetical protein
MPTRIDATSTLPPGHGVYDTTTFATSCAHDDPACYARCTDIAEACGSQWAQWTSENSFLSFSTVSPTAFSTTTITSQSYSYSESVVQQGEARITYQYAFPIGEPTMTTTNVSTFYAEDYVVTRWTEPPPTCTPTNWAQCTKGPDCRACTVQGGTVEVLFWPPENKASINKTDGTSTRNFSNSSTAVRNSVSQPLVTAMFGTHTLTSPSVYISFQTAYALNDCGQTVGKAMPGALLPMDPESLFTVQAGLDYFEVTSGGSQTTFYQSASFDYNDFVGLVPPSAYTNQPSCLAHGCYTIYPDYHPQLVLPPQVRSMDPAWDSCALDWHGAWDPPIALSKADAIAVPTNPAEASFTEPASPKSTISNPAAMTSAPAELSDPSRTSSVLVSSSSISEDSESLFTYLPLSPSDETRLQSTLVASQYFDKGNSASSVIQVTTIIQIDPQPTTSETVVSDTASALYSGHEHSAGTSEHDGLSTEQNSHGPTDSASDVATGTISKPETSEASHPIASTIAQPVSKVHGGGLAIADTVITAGGNAVTIASVVYSAVSGDQLLVISDVPTISSTHSPTNAYEVLSEALGSAEGHQTYSSGGKQSETVSPSTTLSTPQDGTRLPEATLYLGSTTITATQHPNSILQIGSQILNSANPIITINGHTLSTASNAIIVDGTTAATFTQQPAQIPTILTLGTSLLTAQAAAASSGAVEIGSLTLVPGSSALVTNGHTLSAAASGLVLDGSLVVPRVNTSVSTSLQSLPSVQVGGGSGLLPSVTGGSAIDSEGGEVVSSGGEAAGGGVVSSAGHLRQVGSFSWFTCVVMLVASAW